VPRFTPRQSSRRFQGLPAPALLVAALPLPRGEAARAERSQPPGEANRSPPKRAANTCASSGVLKQNTTKTAASARRTMYVSGAADSVPAKARTVSLFVGPRTFSGGSATPHGPNES
jgi:hypothetical protein